jgi:hypothetical protein
VALIQLTVILIIMAIKSLVDGREEESEVTAKPVLRSAQGTATGSYTSGQEAPRTMTASFKSPTSNANQLDACEKAQWSANTSHFH